MPDKDGDEKGLHEAPDFIKNCVIELLTCGDDVAVVHLVGGMGSTSAGGISGMSTEDLLRALEQ